MRVKLISYSLFLLLLFPHVLNDPINVFKKKKGINFTRVTDTFKLLSDHVADCAADIIIDSELTSK